MDIENIIKNYVKAKEDCEKYRCLIQDDMQEYIDKYIIGRCFIFEDISYGETDKYFIYKVNRVQFLERNMFDFDLYGEKIYECIDREVDDGSRFPPHEAFIYDMTNVGIRTRLPYPKNIYEYFNNGFLYKEYQEDKFIEELKKETNIEGIENFPDINNYQYK